MRELGRAVGLQSGLMSLIGWAESVLCSSTRLLSGSLKCLRCGTVVGNSIVTNSWRVVLSGRKPWNEKLAGFVWRPLLLLRKLVFSTVLTSGIGGRWFVLWGVRCVSICLLGDLKCSFVRCWPLVCAYGMKCVMTCVLGRFTVVSCCCVKLGLIMLHRCEHVGPLSMISVCCMSWVTELLVLGLGTW